MLKRELLKKLFEELKSAENPFVFYDDDPDGMISFVLIKKRFGHFSGTVVKGAPCLDESYASKADDNSADKVIVLDKPMLSSGFVDNVNAQIIWVDHHEPQKVPKKVSYFNPRIHNPKDISPTSYMIYKAVGGPLWLAMCGVVSDWYVCPELKKLSKEMPDLLPKVESPPQILYGTGFGKLIRMVDFLIKKNTSDINKSVNDLLRISSPTDILERETPEGERIYENFEAINKEYEPLLKKALEKDDKNLLLFTYGGMKRSFTSELSNELLEKASSRLIIVARKKDGAFKMSIRSRDIVLPPLIKKALRGIDGYGGGHEHACGANIPVSDFNKFVEGLKEGLK